MAPMSKDNDVLTAAPETNSAVRAATGARTEDTSTGSRPQPVALEVPVTVNGARTVEGSDKREPFSETTKTVLVFGNGAVIRLGSPVAPGQLLFLTNEKTKKEVVCQVVKSKNYKSVSGYVELEFTESVVGFWGMRFPSDRISAQAPAPTATIPPAVRGNPVAPVLAAPRPVTPIVSVAPKTPDIKPAQFPAVQIHAEAQPAPHMRPAEVKAVAPVAPKPESPVAQAPAIAPSLASSLANLLRAPDALPVAAPSKPPAPSIPPESTPMPARVTGENSTEDLKLQAARLQEQLSSMLFSAAPAARAVPAAPALDPKTVSSVAAKVLEVTKWDSAPVKAAPPVRTAPPPIKSSLDTEEVKIPSWLEPLARNAAAPNNAQELIEREKAKQAGEFISEEEHSQEPVAVADVESVPAVELPGIGSLLPLDEGATFQDRTSRGSGRGVMFGAIAAGVLLAAGSAWYLLRPTNAVQGTSAPVTPAVNTQANAALTIPSATQPATQPAPQTIVSTPPAASNSNATPVSSTPSSNAPLAKPPVTQQPVPVTRDNTRGAATTIPAAATERISRPAQEPEPEPKKPALGEVHLASPTMNRPAAALDDAADAPTISAGNTDANPTSLSSGLVAGNGKQPAAPEAPLPVGGDVKSARLISKVDPLYPALAKNQHVSGDVRVDALIDPNGRVTTMKIISGPTLLHQAAMEALRQWKYQPASLDGKPVAMHLTVTLQFRLQ
jgi:protein TonB